MKHLHAADVVGAARLAASATLGVTTITEGVHQSVLQTLGRPQGHARGQAAGVAGWVYQAVRDATRLVGHGVDTALTRLQPLFEAADRDAPETPQRQAVLAALNGVLGDHLAATGNPLATPLSMRCQGQALDLDSPMALPGATGKILLLLHGLCMNDLQWSVPVAPEGVHNHGMLLAEALGYTPVYLRYNTGRSIVDNGRELSDRITPLLKHWPVPVSALSVVGHSMGGLVARSALHQAQLGGQHWPSQVRHLVFLGTPHLGAPLEKAGHWVDVMLGSTPYSRPLAQLSQMRSTGITDLRHGRVSPSDAEAPLGLPTHIACYAVAATLAARRSLLADRLLGDGLVPLPSALTHGTSGQRIVYKTGHIELLGSMPVAQQMIDWMG